MSLSKRITDLLFQKLKLLFVYFRFPKFFKNKNEELCYLSDKIPVNVTQGDSTSYAQKVQKRYTKDLIFFSLTNKKM